MHRTLFHNNQIIKLNGERIPRTYTAEVINTVEQEKNKSHSAVAIEFDLTFLGMDPDGLLNFKMQVQKRFLLNEKFSMIRNLDKAQKIALKVAAINDILVLKVDKNFKLNKVVNTLEILQKWKKVKVDLLKEFPDLLKITSDFDWQLQEENIQQVFIEDNFYQFFFSNIFYQEFEDNKTIDQEKVVVNALGSLNIPIIEQKRIVKQGISIAEISITSEAEINIDPKKFPLAKLNAFLGKLPTKLGDKHILDFNYKGTYKVKPENGLMTNGTLAYSLEVKDLYKKTTTINFNLENDE